MKRYTSSSSKLSQLRTIVKMAPDFPAAISSIFEVRSALHRSRLTSSFDSQDPTLNFGNCAFVPGQVGFKESRVVDADVAVEQDSLTHVYSCFLCKGSAMRTSFAWGMTQPNTADGRSMHERCDQSFSADGLSSTEKCDISTDGKTWQPFYELRSIKLKRTHSQTSDRT